MRGVPRRIEALLDDELIGRILDRYGLRPVAMHEQQKGYRNLIRPVTVDDGRCVNVIVYKREPGIAARICKINRVSRFLANDGFPVREPLDPRITRLRYGQHERYAGVYTYLPGSTIPWEAYTKHHIKLLGRTLSDIHASLYAFPEEYIRENAGVADEYLRINDRMRIYFADSRVQNSMRQKLNLSIPVDTFTDFTRLLRTCASLPGQQTLHMDFVRSNILFVDAPHEDNPANISGILDMEKAAYGIRAFDVSRTWAFLLVDCKYKAGDKITKYLLHSGYDKRGAIPLDEYSWNMIGCLRDMFLVHDLYKFLRHNPYETLLQNEHFRRTIEVLIGEGIVNGKLPPVADSAYDTMISNRA